MKDDVLSKVYRSANFIKKAINFARVHERSFAFQLFSSFIQVLGNKRKEKHIYITY